MAKRKKKTKLKVAHASLQFSDREKHKEADIKALFEHAIKKNYWWITGTEGKGRRRGTNDKENSFYLKKYAPENGYYFFMDPENDSWILIKMDVVDWMNSTKNYFYRRVVPASRDHGRRGVLSKTFKNNLIGTVTVSAGHYLTRGNPYAKDPARRERVSGNRKLARRFGRRLMHMARGKRLSFFGSDVNIAGSPETPDQTLIPGMVTCWEEVGKWPGTGHGNIDVVARPLKDTRVECVSARVYRDNALFLHMDHFLVEAEYEIVNV